MQADTHLICGDGSNVRLAGIWRTLFFANAPNGGFGRLQRNTLSSGERQLRAVSFI